jgi:hypothetical protein
VKFLTTLFPLAKLSTRLAAALLITLLVIVALPCFPASSHAEALDQYGGLTAVRCTKGSSPHFYTAKLGDRWWLCDPAGNGFFMKGVAFAMPNVDAAQVTLNQGRYATGPTGNWELNWSIEQVNRLRSWGFNTVADDSYAGMTPSYEDNQWDTTDHTIPAAQRMPYTFLNDTSRYVFQNSAGCAALSPIKDLIHGVGPVYTGYRYNYGDYFDPGFPACVANIIKTSKINAIANAIHSDYLLYITIDESDQTGGLLSSAGPDFPSLPPGRNGSGHPGWITLVTAPTQAANGSWSATYTDPTVYTKLALSKSLAVRYHNRIVALNTAWGANYASFASAGGWGKGAGLLDEDGTCPSRASWHRCWVGDQSTLAGETAAMRADLSAFYSYYLEQYLSVMRSQWHNPAFGAPGVLLQMQLGGWATPPRQEALSESAKYIDLPQLTPIPPPPWGCPAGGCADRQQRVDFVARYLGDHPWINWLGVDANPDSAESAYPSSVGSPYTTQAERGAAYEAMMTAQLNARDTVTGTYHVVGFYWWAAFDMDGEQLNWGLITPRDNPYDGTSATIAGDGKDQWGYPTGGEKRNYGNFLRGVKTANFAANTIQAAKAAVSMAAPPLPAPGK